VVPGVRRNCKPLRLARSQFLHSFPRRFNARVDCRAGTGCAMRSGMATHEIQERAYRFGRDVMLYALACESTSLIGRELLRQLFRAAASVGANLQEAQAAVSKRDFNHKVAIARKEAFESRHWLRLRRDMCPDDNALPGLQQEAEEVCRVLSAILRSASRSNSRGGSSEQ
jgi:four helix bundle protein